MKSVGLVPLLGVVWGLNWAAVRTILDEIGPWTLRTVGIGLAALVLVIVAKSSGISLRLQRRDVPRVVAVGMLTVAAFNILAAFAQLHTPTGRAAIATFTMPIWATLLARIVLGEALTPPRIAGLVLGCAGLAALAWPLIQAHDVSLGVVLAVLAGMSWAAGTVLLKARPVDAHPIAMAAWQLIFSAAVVAVGMAVFEGWPVLRPLSPRTLVALAYHIVLAQAGGYLLWFLILSKLPASVASIGTLLVPAVGVGGAMLFLGERPTATDYVGLCLVVAASAAVLLAPAHRPKASS